MTNLDSILKNRDITLLTKVCLVKAMVFLVVIHGCESSTIEKTEGRRTDAFELWCWRRLLRVPWTTRRSNQHHNLKASILRHSAFFMVQLSHRYMTTGKTIALTRWTFVSKVMSLFFNMLSTFIIAFLPRSKRLLISWLQSPSVVTLEPKKIKSVTVSIVSPSICHEVMIPYAVILVY